MGEFANDRVLIVGVGGLGAPAAAALVRAGIRKIGLIDSDPVELSNLPRQVIYGASDIGTPKVLAAARRLSEICPVLQVETHHYELDAGNATKVISGYGFVIDATDNPTAKFLINDTCVALRRPFVYAGVIGMTGQAMTVIPGRTACLRCLFEELPDVAEIASCREAGIVGPVAGAIGEAEAAEAVRWIHGEMPALAGLMLTYDATTIGRTRLTQIAARAGCGCGAAEAAVSTFGPSTR
jgi:molybdopterin-synthase adenylyltransferase